MRTNKHQQGRKPEKKHSDNKEHPFARFEKKKKPPFRNEPPSRKEPDNDSRFSTRKEVTRKKNTWGKEPTSDSKKQTPVPHRSSHIFPLNKYLAHCGLCARRKAVEYIKSGEVTVNGRKILEPGFKVTNNDLIRFRDKRLHLEQKAEYLLVNKPKDCLTTTKDPRDRRTVMDLIRAATNERVYPVGRLDRNTTGLLLLTNDGDLAQQLSHPSGKIKKIYHVTLNKPLQKKDFDQILAGIELEDGMMAADALAFVDGEDHTQVGMEIHSGRNRIVRRTFESLGYEVKHLDRVLYAGLTKKNLPRGKWRPLKDKEIRILKHFTPGKSAKPNNPRL